MSELEISAHKRDWLAISWFRHRRLDSLCATLNVRLHVLTSNRARLIRYAKLTTETILILTREKPSHLLIQNPSIGLALLAIVLRPFFKFRVIVDAHNEAITPYIHNTLLVRTIAALILRFSDLTIVTNRELARIVETKGGRPFVLFDYVPDAPANLPTPVPGGRRVILISTFAPDEPTRAVIDAARILGQEYSLFITGRVTKKIVESLSPVPGNTVFTDYLDDAAYWELLASANVVIDLTDMPYCLVCGAYETLSVGRPLVVSDDPALRSLLNNAAIYTGHTPQNIADAILSAFRREKDLAQAARNRAKELRNLFRTDAIALLSATQGLR